MCIEGESEGKDEGRQQGNKVPYEVYEVAGRNVDVTKNVRPMLRMQRRPSKHREEDHGRQEEEYFDIRYDVKEVRKGVGV